MNDELYAQIIPLFAGDTAPVVEGTVMDLCWYTAKIKRLEDQINAEGDMVETPRGLRKNPAIDVLTRYMASKNVCLKTLLPVLRSHQAKDELMNFIADA